MLRLMSSHNRAKFRLATMSLHLKPAPPCFAKQAGGVKTIDIAGVVKALREPPRPDLVPVGFVDRLRTTGDSFSPETLGHLRWMLQKDLLGQDQFLIGSPGPSRRQLALAFAELTGREVEYVSISRDTTESDLKQRRELIGGTSVCCRISVLKGATQLR